MRKPVKQPNHKHKIKLSYILVPAVAIILLVIFVFARIVGDINSDVDGNDQGQKVFDYKAHSIDEPNSIWVVINKQRPLPLDHTPSNLVVPSVPLYGSSDAENMQVDTRLVQHLEELISNADDSGISLAIGSAYRSSQYQSGIYNLYVERAGQEEADQFSARPGHSEHQSGLAVDFVRPDGECFIERCFEDTPEGQWLRQNAHKFGFILRYEEDTQDITGYQYEPWHYRYVGPKLSQELNTRGNPTLEEFFGLPPAPAY